MFQFLAFKDFNSREILTIATLCILILGCQNGTHETQSLEVETEIVTVADSSFHFSDAH